MTYQGRKKCANFTREEIDLLYDLYQKNYETYHFKYRGVIKSGEPTPREKLLQQWSELVSAVGVQKREPVKIKEKLKKDMYVARNLLMDYKKKVNEAGNGKSPPDPRSTHPNYSILFDLIEKHSDPNVGKSEPLEDECDLVGTSSASNDANDEENEAINLKWEQLAEEMNEQIMANFAPKRRANDLEEELTSEKLQLVKEEREVAEAKKRKLDLECKLLEREIELVNGVAKILQKMF